MNIIQYNSMHKFVGVLDNPPVMGETGNDLPLLDVNPGQFSQESALSGEET